MNRNSLARVNSRGLVSTCVVLGTLWTSIGLHADEPTTADVLRGRLKQLRACLERSSQSLEQSNVPEFVEQYRRLSAAFSGTAEATEQSFRELGAARMKVRLARQLLA